MRKKISLKHAAIGTLVGLAVAGTSISYITPVTYAQDNVLSDPVNNGAPTYEISEIIFDPSDAAPGETVRVRALTDASGQDIFTVMLEIPVNENKTEHVYLTHGENDVLEGSFTIGDNWSNGEHAPVSVTVTDTDHNTEKYDTSDTSVGSFTVHDSSQNFDPPVLNSITYDRTELRMGEAVTISVDVTKASDIEELIITFANEDNKFQSVGFENGSMVHTKELTGWDEGTYRVSSVYIRDKSGNREYYEENDNLDEVKTSAFSISNTYNDTQGPLVSEVSFDKTSAGPGDTVTIIANAHDSTAVNSVTVEVTSPDGEKHSYYLNENTDADDEIPDGAFFTQVYIDNDFPNGEYTVTYISAEDISGNRSEYIPGEDTEDLNVGSFTVTGSAYDKEAPQIKRIEFSNGIRFRPGETCTVKLWLEDANDIWEAGLCLFIEDTNDEFGYFEGVLQDDGSYLFEFTVDNQWFNCDYDVRVSTTDELSNSALHKTGLQVTVYESPEDYFPPEVMSVHADKTDVKPDDVVAVTADIFEHSLVNYILGGLFYDGEPIRDDDGYEIFFPFLPGEDGLYRTNIEITHKFLNGTYDLKIHTNDQWDNYEDDIDTGIEINVSGSQEHTDPPVVTSILFDKTECVPGDEFTMTAIAEDEIDIKYVKVYLAPSDGTYDERYNPHLYLTLYPDENGIFSATEIVDNTWLNKTYEVMYVIAEDLLGNTIEYDDELLTDMYISKELALNFLTVSGSAGVSSELHVSEILFDRETVKIGETVNITAKTTGSGTAKELVLEIANEALNRIVWNKKVYVYPDEEGKLTGSFRIDPSDSYWQNDLEYGISSALLLDSENDSRYYANGINAEIMDDLRDIDRNTFTVDTYSPPALDPADYSAVDAALADVPEDLSIYLPDGVEALNAAIGAVIRGKTELEQLLVNSYATAIRNAIGALSLKPADYTGVDKAIASVPEKLEDYTEDSVNALETAIKAVNRGLLIDEQEKVDSFAHSISAAVNNLELKPADYSKVERAMETIPQDLSLYTDESVKVLKDALYLERDLKIDQQEQVDRFAEAIETAVAGLKKKESDPPAEKDIKNDDEKQGEGFVEEETDPKDLKKEESDAPEKKEAPEKTVTVEKKTVAVSNSTVTPQSTPAAVYKNTSPETGDNNNVAVWSAVSGISLAGTVAAAAIIRRRSKR